MWSSLPAVRDFYPRPPRGGRLQWMFAQSSVMVISIHALREEGDSWYAALHIARSRYFYPRPPRGGRQAALVLALAILTISIHALREEGDFLRVSYDTHTNAFLSTPSARRATGRYYNSMSTQSDFYPRPPRGGRPSDSSGPTPSRGISIHALREEGDFRRSHEWESCGAISIHALREEGDCARSIVTGRNVISIHALREEGDPAHWRSCPR